MDCLRPRKSSEVTTSVVSQKFIAEVHDGNAGSLPPSLTLRSTQDQQSALRIAIKISQANRVAANNGQNFVSRAIARLQQDHFGRRASCQAEADKVLVLGQKGESMYLGIFPDEFIGCAPQSNRIDVY